MRRKNYIGLVACALAPLFRFWIWEIHIAMMKAVVFVFGTDQGPSVPSVGRPGFDYYLLQLALAVYPNRSHHAVHNRNREIQEHRSTLNLQRL